MQGVNQQLKELIAAGSTVDEAAEALGLDVEAATYAVQSERNEDVNINELLERYRPKMVKILAHIAEYGENENARVRAAGLILQGEGKLPEVSANKMEEYFEKMKKIKEQVKIIDTETSVETKELVNV